MQPKFSCLWSYVKKSIRKWRCFRVVTQNAQYLNTFKGEAALFKYVGHGQQSQHSKHLIVRGTDKQDETNIPLTFWWTIRTLYNEIYMLFVERYDIVVSYGFIIVLLSSVIIVFWLFCNGTVLGVYLYSAGSPERLDALLLLHFHPYLSWAVFIKCSDVLRAVLCWLSQVKVYRGHELSIIVQLSPWNILTLQFNLGLFPLYQMVDSHDFIHHILEYRLNVTMSMHDWPRFGGTLSNIGIIVLATLL